MCVTAQTVAVPAASIRKVEVQGVNNVTRSSLAANLSDRSSQAEYTGGHPTLAPAARSVLAERIAAVDGIGVPEAQRNIEEFLRCDLTGSAQR